MAKRDRVLTQLRDLIQKTMIALKDEDTTPRDIANKALEEAQKLAKDRLQDMLRRVLVRLAGEQLRGLKNQGAAVTTPILRGLEDVLLPHRIAVPWLGLEPDEDNTSCVWRALHRCSLDDLAANLRMRLQGIEGAQAERNRLLRVYETAVAAGGTSEDIIGTVLGPLLVP